MKNSEAREAIFDELEKLGIVPREMIEDFRKRYLLKDEEKNVALAYLSGLEIEMCKRLKVDVVGYARNKIDKQRRDRLRRGEE